MKKFLYITALLDNYTRLNGLIERLEWTVYNRALATHGFNGTFPVTTFEQTAEIIKLIDRKNVLSSIKIAVVKALNRLEKDDRLLLVKRFIKDITPSKVAEVLKISKSTYYYRLENCLEKFGELLARDGYDRDWFEQNFGERAWFRKLFRVRKNSEAIKKSGVGCRIASGF